MRARELRMNRSHVVFYVANTMTYTLYQIFKFYKNIEY
jgi:hypothetical protein